MFYVSILWDISAHWSSQSFLFWTAYLPWTNCCMFNAFSPLPLFTLLHLFKSVTKVVQGLSHGCCSSIQICLAYGLRLFFWNFFPICWNLKFVINYSGFGWTFYVSYCDATFSYWLFFVTHENLINYLYCKYYKHAQLIRQLPSQQYSHCCFFLCSLPLRGAKHWIQQQLPHESSLFSPGHY